MFQTTYTQVVKNTRACTSQVIADLPEPPASSSFNSNHIIRRLLIIIPIGVIGNPVYSWLTTDVYDLRNFLTFSYPYLVLSVVVALLPWAAHAMQIVLWTRLLSKPL